jgi:hypothetical protein
MATVGLGTRRRKSSSAATSCRADADTPALTTTTGRPSAPNKRSTYRLPGAFGCPASNENCNGLVEGVAAVWRRKSTNGSSVEIASVMSDRPGLSPNRNANPSARRAQRALAVCAGYKAILCTASLGSIGKTSQSPPCCRATCSRMGGELTAVELALKSSRQSEFVIPLPGTLWLPIDLTSLPSTPDPDRFGPNPLAAEGGASRSRAASASM